MVRSAAAIVPYENSLLADKSAAKTKRPPGNRATFSFQGRIVPTEAKNSVKTFWTKSYGPKKESVKQFLVNKCLCFQLLESCSNIPKFHLIVRQKVPDSRLSQVFRWIYLRLWRSAEVGCRLWGRCEADSERSSAINSISSLPPWK